MRKHKKGDVPAHVPSHLVFEVDVYEDPALEEELHENLGRYHQLYPDVFFTPFSEGYWVVRGQSAVSEVMQSPDRFSTAVGLIPKPEKPVPLLPLSLDPPEHTPYRAALMKVFGPKYVNDMATDIRHRAEQIIDAVAAQGSCEFLSAVGAALPVTVFMNMFGLPVERFDEFRELVLNFFQPLTEQERQTAHQRMIDEMLLLIEARTREPRDDLLSHLVHDEVAMGRRLGRDELLSMSMLLFVAGMDTVANAATFAFHHLAQRPDLQQRLAADSAAVPHFVEESLRMFGNINTPRIVARDTSLGGVDMRKGDMMLVMLSIAGRDGNWFADRPGEFHLDRDHHPHMTFGGGPHVCIGRHLAKIELNALVEAWVRRIPSFSLLPGFKPSFRSFQVMAMERLDLVWQVSGSPSQELGSALAQSSDAR